MTKTLSGKKSLISTVVIGAIILAIGILIINHTDSFLKIVMIAAGIGAFLDGFYTLMGVKKWKYTDLTKNLTLIKGFESLVLGIAAVIMAIFAADAALTVMVYIFAISLVFSAVVALQNAAVAGKFGITDKRTSFIIEAAIEALIALLLFFKPVETLVKVVQILAIVFIVIGFIMIAIPIIVLIKGTGKTSEEAVVVEAEVVDTEEKEK